MAITCVTAKCELGFFCKDAEKREASPPEEENYFHDGMEMKKPKFFKTMKLARNRAIARFLANGYEFLDKENDY